METEAVGEGDGAADCDPAAFDAVTHAVSEAEAQPETVEQGVGEAVLSTVSVVLILCVPLSVRSREGEAPLLLEALLDPAPASGLALPLSEESSDLDAATDRVGENELEAVVGDTVPVVLPPPPLEGEGGAEFETKVVAVAPPNEPVGPSLTVAVGVPTTVEEGGRVENPDGDMTPVALPAPLAVERGESLTLPLPLGRALGEGGTENEEVAEGKPASLDDAPRLKLPTSVGLRLPLGVSAGEGLPLGVDERHFVTVVQEEGVPDEHAS